MAKRRGIRDLFFIKRRPKWNVPREWEMPADPAAYQGLIQQHDFITADDIGAFLAAQPMKDAQGKPVDADQFVTVRADLEFLQQPDYLGEYFRNEQESRHWQNLYYRYHWFFGIFAVLTTLASVVTLVAVDAQDQTVRLVVALFAATMGALTTFIGTRMRSMQPQYKWYAARRRSEVLRSHYFLFFAHARPYRGSDYERKSRLFIVAAQAESIGRTSTSTAEVQPVSGADDDQFTRSEHEEWETEFVKWAYIQRRFDLQIEWYQDRILEFDENSSFTALVAAALLALAAVLAAFSASTTSVALHVLLVLLPSIAATLVGAQQIYGWDRQSQLYGGSLAQLKDLRARLKLDNPAIDNEREVAYAVEAVEKVFGAESDQWGQEVLSAPIQDSRSALLDQLDDTLEQINLSDEVRARIRKMAEANDTARRPAAASPANPVEPPVSSS